MPSTPRKRLHNDENTGTPARVLTQRDPFRTPFQPQLPTLFTWNLDWVGIVWSQLISAAMIYKTENRENTIEMENTECRAWICCDELILLERNFLFGSMFGVWKWHVFNHGQVLLAVLVRVTGPGPVYFRPGGWYRAYKTIRSNGLGCRL